MISDRLRPTLQKHFGMEHIVLVGRGALGIYAALRIWSGGKRTIVALSSAVCQDVIAAISAADCVPFFCDINPATGVVPQDEWLRARSAGATAAIVVHLYGNPTELFAVRRIFEAPECLLIDDAAQALGATTIEGNLAGTTGDVGILSFGNTKHIRVGGGALLLRDSSLAQECRSLLESVAIFPEKIRAATEARFRTGFDAARTRLRQNGDSEGFRGLLNGYESTLYLPWRPEWNQEITSALQNLPRIVEIRSQKAAAWAVAIKDTGLVPVGMGKGSSPWRFTCRLPDAGWPLQHTLGSCLRAQGMHVSHWYLPGHWFGSFGHSPLPGVEKLAKEVFQFWLDEATPMEAIEKWATGLQECFDNVLSKEQK